MNTLPMLKSRATALTVSVSALLALGACATTAQPTAKMAVAESAVQHASNASTREHAPSQLQIATQKLASARQAMVNQNYELAERLAEQAELDAQVAVLHAQSMRTRLAAQESQAAAQALRDEINRKTYR